MLCCIVLRFGLLVYADVHARIIYVHAPGDLVGVCRSGWRSGWFAPRRNTLNSFALVIKGSYLAMCLATARAPHRLGGGGSQPHAFPRCELGELVENVQCMMHGVVQLDDGGH